MRFAHRRRMDEGEFAQETGGFFATPPATPPHRMSSPINDLTTSKGELGDFSSPLHVGGNTPARRYRYIDHPAGALATSTSTPPAHLISAAKSPQHHDNSDGGVFGETPPDPPIDPLGTACGLSSDIITGLRLLKAQPAPAITRPVIWGGVVNDALALAIRGWARRALDLGWDVDDIFGVGVRSSDAFEGLAVWLAGREVDVLAEWKAVTTCGAVFFREAFGRPNSPRLPSVPLWQFGRTSYGATPRRTGHHQGSMT